MAISETSDVITYSDHLAMWVRIFVGILGIVMAVIGPATMISIAFPLWTLSFAFAVFTGVVLLLFGLFALMAAFGSRTTLEFRAAERILVVSRSGPFIRSRVEHDFSAVTGPSFAMRDSEDGAFPVLSLRLSGKRFPFEMVGFAGADEARLWQGRLENILAVPG